VAIQKSYNNEVLTNGFVSNKTNEAKKKGFQTWAQFWQDFIEEG
jgi:hypothetical protein